MNIAVVTSCHNYGKYLMDWAKSIVELTTHRPVMCAIVDNGSTDTTPHLIEDAISLIESAGIPCVTDRIHYCNFGAARNHAVAISGDSEWVVHLDADDMFMPHFLEDVVALAPKADVVGAGYIRVGDLQAGPRNRTRVYSSHQGEATLQSNAPCSGVSPFRRSFWERRPYRTDMRGGWDTALWIGFAHLNARFVATRRPVFKYRQHADSVFNQRWPNERKTHLVGVKLGNLRRQIDQGVDVIVPWMPDNAERDKAWAWVKERYARLHPDWNVVEGSSPAGKPWRKGLAVRDALTRAKGSTIVIADADVFVVPEALHEAVRLVQTGEANWVVPHKMVKRLAKAPTNHVLANGDVPQDGPYTRKPYVGYAGGGLVVIDRSYYEAVGGIPDVFVGWGAEDECLALILDTIVGEHTRLDYDLVHLWHSPTRRMKDTTYTSNRGLLRVYLEKAGDPDEMWELVKFVNAGNHPTEYRKVSGGILMIAIEKHQRGPNVIDVGETFRATEVEARRYESLHRKIAKRMTGSLLSLRTNREKTLNIRAEQAQRNEEAISERGQRLAMLERRT